MSVHHLLAIDLGAESGRAVAGILEKKRLFLEEIHRFPTGMIQLDGHFYWNIFRFYEEIIQGINICKNKEQIKPESIAIDSWGVDFGLFGEDGRLIRIPYAYRDPQATEGRDHFINNIISARQLYDYTGIAIQPFNSVFHLHAQKMKGDFAIQHAKKLLFIPDILNYFLTGKMLTEFSFATTSQLYNPLKGTWEQKIFEKLGVDISIMNDIIKPGQNIGMLRADLARQAVVDPFPVTAVCSHDTGSAIVAVPAEGEDFAYISSGTWSLMGIEINEPIINRTSFENNFTNEGGADGTFRFLKNIMGLWLLQECRKSWSKTGYQVSYTDLVETAKTASAFKTFIDPDYPGFYNPVDMPSEIDNYCTSTMQESPETVGEYVRTILEGLAFKYRFVLDQLREINVKKINRIHIIGGGSKNKVLCQYTANVTGLKVITGPAEGTAAGNVLMQAKALGYLESLYDIREVVKNSFEFETYKPERTDEWNSAYLKWKKATGIGG
jgi:rhamnulokinase